MRKHSTIELILLTFGVVTALLLLPACSILPIRLESPSDSSDVAHPILTEVQTSQYNESGSNPGLSSDPQPTPTPVPTLAPSSETDSFARGSKLPVDPLVERFFGPLPTPKSDSVPPHNTVRALYLGAAANIDATLEIARDTEVNAVVIDLKESDGIKYASTVPLAIESNSVKPAYNLSQVVERFHAEDVIVIGRIVCFKDPILAENRPDLAIQDESGTVLQYKLEGRKPFVSPYNQTVWQYNIDLALEAIAAGVDEIQFDYIRFPTGGTTSGQAPYFGPEGEVPSKSQAINRFIQYARIQIEAESGVPLGVDVFATIIVSASDGRRIGQDWSTLGLTGVDNICPMIYPSHYANDATDHYTGNGTGSILDGRLFTKPDLFPYDVMAATLKTGQPAMEQTGYTAAIRPYLQAFTASYLPDSYYMPYGASGIREQIRAIRDAGFNEWVCWNSRAVYPIEAFDPQT